LQGPQGAAIQVAGRDVVTFAPTIYLGLANHPDIVAAASDGLKRFGYGMASVRFICGTRRFTSYSKARSPAFLARTMRSLQLCWDANGGLFETILGEDDAVISDELNHASIIDGVRLCKATRFRYKNCDLADLERCLSKRRRPAFA